ncbi:MAG: hypothetical protein V1849_00045 [Chloroflexota bacterium]
MKEGSKSQSGWRRLGAWLMIVAFLVILYLMGAAHWHVLRLFYFIPLFVLLCLALIIGVGWITREEQ